MKWTTLGFDKIKRLFERQIESETLNQAYLFYGQDQIGKKSFACELASKLLSGQGELDRNPDFKYICPISLDHTKQISIEDVRNLTNFNAQGPIDGTKKFIVIDEADKLTHQAQNALLKVLEEPSSTSVFLLVTSYPDALLGTIVSRCIPLYFASHSVARIKAELADKNLKADQLEFVANFSNGRLGIVRSHIVIKRFEEIKKSVRRLVGDLKKPVYKKFDLLEKDIDATRAQLLADIVNTMLYLRKSGRNNNWRLLKRLQWLYFDLSDLSTNTKLVRERFLINA